CHRHDQGRRKRHGGDARGRLVERTAQLRQYLESLRRPAVAAGQTRRHLQGWLLRHDHHQRQDVEILRRRPPGIWQPRFRRILRCCQGARRGRMDHCCLSRQQMEKRRCGAARRYGIFGHGSRTGGRTGDAVQLCQTVPRRPDGNNAGVFRTLTAKSVKEVRPGVYVYNMGQNLVGVPRISIANGRAGGRITLRYAETSYPDLKESGKNVGMIMTENYRGALSQDVYTMKTGSQVFQPRFTSHGFQYVEITGIDKPLPLEAVQGVAISSVRELTADYKTSSEKVNRLWSNLV